MINVNKGIEKNIPSKENLAKLTPFIKISLKFSKIYKIFAPNISTSNTKIDNNNVLINEYLLCLIP